MGGRASDLFVDGLGDVVGEERGVAEVGSVFLVLASRPPGGHHVGVSAQGQGKYRMLGEWEDKHDLRGKYAGLLSHCGSDDVEGGRLFAFCMGDIGFET